MQASRRLGSHSALLPAGLPLAPRAARPGGVLTLATGHLKVLKRAADVLKIPAIWLVHAGCSRAATSRATSFWRVDGSQDW